MGVAKFGEPMVHTEVYGPDLGEQVYVGLFACSHNAAVKETATFSNVRIVVPPKTGWVPYRDYIGSNLEVWTSRPGPTVVHTSPISIQAPNWTPDGKTLIFNGSGKLWTFDLATRAVAELDRAATRNNNDHVLSFDGTMLGISSHSQEPGRQPLGHLRVPAPAASRRASRPIRRPICTAGHSTSSGCSNRATQQRAGHLQDSRRGGEEVRLTTTEGVDDGSELTPDGQWMYFNSNRSGHMQIWRMKPDGAISSRSLRPLQQLVPAHRARWQIDGDHLLRRGHRSADHPFYKHVYLRHMALDGSNAEGDRLRVRRPGHDQRAVVVTGRQGIAFVSNRRCRRRCRVEGWRRLSTRAAASRAAGRAGGDDDRVERHLEDLAATVGGPEPDRDSLGRPAARSGSLQRPNLQAR